VTEADLAERSGISRSELATARERCLLADLDYEKKKNGVVLLPTGIAKLAAHLGITIPSESAAIPADPWIMLVVIRRAKVNRHVIFAGEKKEGAEIAVRVRDAAMFVPGQQIRVLMQTPVSGVLWGPQPRRRGRILRK
jgi:hypothetical protein